MQLIWKNFHQLTLDELYAIIKLRIDVFVVEQDCPWPDLDDCDQKSWHLCLWQNTKLAAYARLYAEKSAVKLQRVITAKDFRGQGLGHKLMAASLSKAQELYPNFSVKIGAQARLKKFYEGHGFQVCSDPYDDLGILHIDMEFTPSAKAA